MNITIKPASRADVERFEFSAKQRQNVADLAIVARIRALEIVSGDHEYGCDVETGAACSCRIDKVRANLAEVEINGPTEAVCGKEAKSDND